MNLLASTGFPLTYHSITIVGSPIGINLASKWALSPSCKVKSRMWVVNAGFCGGLSSSGALALGAALSTGFNQTTSRGGEPLKSHANCLEFQT